MVDNLFFPWVRHSASSQPGGLLQAEFVRFLAVDGLVACVLAVCEKHLLKVKLSGGQRALASQQALPSSLLVFI